MRRTRGGIAYFTGGTGDSLLLLLHGLGATAAVWRRLIPLVEESWDGRWAAPDLRGCDGQRRVKTHRVRLRDDGGWHVRHDVGARVDHGGGRDRA